MNVRVRAKICGLVQGVSFRFHTREEAQRLGLRGFVRNLDDGSVELEAEGEQAAVEALLSWCRRGPPSAEVSSVEPSPLPPLGTERGFEVRR